MALFSKNVIRKRVMEVLNARLDAAEKQHDAEIEKLENELAVELEVAQVKHDSAREAAADKIVNAIIGKLL